MQRNLLQSAGCSWKSGACFSCSNKINLTHKVFEMQILTISGSLRAVSSNSAALEAARLLAPAGVTLTPYEGLASLPHFNPDLDTDTPPDIVQALRQQIGACQGLLICSPEYAH